MTNALEDFIYEKDDSAFYDYSDDINNDNDQSLDLSASAFNSLPLTIQQALLQQQRLVLIANNPSITVESLESTLRSSDIVVLFNDFIHADFFATDALAKTLPKLLFFRQIGDSKLHFGLPPRSNKLLAIEQMCQHSSVGVLLSNIAYQFPTLADDPSPQDDPMTTDRVLSIASSLRKVFESAEQCRVLSEQHSVVADYPAFATIHSSAPTSGFLIYRLLLAARRHVQHLQAETQSFESIEPLEIMMLGFNDEDKTAHFWEGHNWAFERQELAAPAAGVEIIRQY